MGRRARALLRSLVERDRSNQYILFLDSGARAEPLPPGCRMRLLESSAPTLEAASANGHRSLSGIWRMSRALWAAEFDAFLFPTIYSYIPLFSRATKLVMVHDVIAGIYPHLTVPRSSVRLLWNAKVALGRAQADALITISDYSRPRILKCFGSDPTRVFVVGEAADPIFRRLPFPAPTPKLRSVGIEGAQRLVVYLSGFSPHKNPKR